MPTSILATVVTARAFYLQGQHVVAIAGRKPAAAEVTLTESAAGDATIVLYLKRSPSESTVIDTYYIIQPVCGSGTLRNAVRILHAGGSLMVPVEPVNCAAQRVTGFSPSFSFDEAFADALRQLPLLNRGPSGQDLPLVDLLAMGAIYGGFSGFSRLFLRVGATTDPGT